MSDDLNIQKTEHGWWFGKGTENLFWKNGGESHFELHRRATTTNNCQSFVQTEENSHNSKVLNFKALGDNAAVEAYPSYNSSNGKIIMTADKNMKLTVRYKTKNHTTGSVSLWSHWNTHPDTGAGQTNDLTLGASNDKWKVYTNDFPTYSYRTQRHFYIGLRKNNEGCEFIVDWVQLEYDIRTPFVRTKRNDTLLKYEGLTHVNGDNYVMVLEMPNQSYLPTATVDVNKKYNLFSNGIKNDPNAGRVMAGYVTAERIASKLTKEKNYVMFIGENIYVNGEKLADKLALHREGAVEAGDNLFRPLRYVNEHNNMIVNSMFIFNRNLNPGKWTEQYCKEVTTHGFIVPEGKSDKPIYGTIPSSDYLVNNHSFFNISSTTEEFKLEGNKLYKVTSAEGIIYTNVTNSSNVVSAVNGSTVVITNTAGIGKINGTPAMPCRIEVSNYYL